MKDRTKKMYLQGRKPFRAYLEEALKELEKPCEEFDSEKCERLLTKCCRVLLEGSDNLSKLVKKNNDKNVEGNPIKRSQDSLRERNLPFSSPIVLEVEDVEELYGKTFKRSQCRRDYSGILLSFPVLSSLGSHNCSPCGLPEAGRGLYRETDELGEAGNSGVQGGCGAERGSVRDEKVSYISVSGSSGIRSGTFLNSNSWAVLGISSDTGTFRAVGGSSSGRSRELFSGLLSQNRKEGISETVAVHSFVSGSALSIGSAGSNGGFWADGSSSSLGSRGLVSNKADKSITTGRFHSNPPKGELSQNCGRDCDRAKKYLVVIDNQTGESVEVSPTEDPAKALAEALSKLTPGVKTTVWNGESEELQQQCQRKNEGGNPDSVNHKSERSKKSCKSTFNL